MDFDQTIARHRKTKKLLTLGLVANLALLIVGCQMSTLPIDPSIPIKEAQAQEAQVQIEDVEVQAKEAQTQANDVQVNEIAIDDVSQSKNKEVPFNLVDARPFLEKYMLVMDTQREINQNFDKGTPYVTETGIPQVIAKTPLTYTEVVAGIVPHHNVAHKMINNFYRETAKNNTYELIIVISPNHRSIGPRFQVALRDYLTYEGIVFFERNVSNGLIKEGAASEASDDVLEVEHGQLVHMHYIQHYFENTPVVSILINETRKYDDIEHFKEQLLPLIKGKKVLLVGSIDFSHYLTLEQANKHDLITYEALTKNNPRYLINKSNDYIDSPSTYALLIEVLNELGKYQSAIVDHGNAAQILKQPSLRETTSYFSILYQMITE